MTSNQEIKENKNEADQSSETGAQAELLSKLRKRLGHDNDTQFAEALGIKKAFFSDLKAGRREIPPMIRLKILDKLGYLSARDALLALTPKGFAERVKTVDNARFSLDLSGLDDTLEPPSAEFGELIAKAIERHGPDAVVVVVKAKILEHKAAKAASKK